MSNEQKQSEGGPRVGVEFDFHGLFRRLETETPERRAELFYLLESRWCWDCGREGDVCLTDECWMDVGPDALSPPPASVSPTVLQAQEKSEET